AALLVLDMQDYFLREDSHAFIPSAPAIIPAVNKLAVSFQAGGRPVWFTRHLNTREDAGMMDPWWRELISGEEASSRISAALDTRGAEVIIKSQYDAFYRTGLEEELHRRKVKQLVITGVMTHLCCESTARSAFARGFAVFLPVDATATYNRNFHRASLLNLAHGVAIPLLASDIWGRFGR
nr:isochorismatase family protein [Candidatus Krumholzibacteriota bacterium]